MMLMLMLIISTTFVATAANDPTTTILVATITSSVSVLSYRLRIKRATLWYLRLIYGPPHGDYYYDDQH